MRYLVIFAFSFPVFAQDWGRYATGYIPPPVLVEMQVIRMLETRHFPTYIAPGNKHPNSVPVVVDRIGQTPPQVGKNGR